MVGQDYQWLFGGNIWGEAGSDTYFGKYTGYSVLERDEDGGTCGYVHSGQKMLTLFN